MNDEQVLLELSSAYGIEPGYWDIKGVYHETSANTRRLLLSAMGVSTESQQSLVEELHRYKLNKLTSIVSNTVVVLAGANQINLVICLEQGVSGENIHWEFCSEYGERSSGEAHKSSLGLIEVEEFDSRRFERFHFTLNIPVALGYHQLLLNFSNLPSSISVSVIGVPERAYLPTQLTTGRRFWGIGCQLYSLRSAQNWGIGDFSDLSNILPKIGSFGGSFLGLNPIPALVPGDYENVSPYFPSCRLSRNIMYIDIRAVPEFNTSPLAQQMFDSPALERKLNSVRNSQFVDYKTVWECKKEFFLELYNEFKQRHLSNHSSRAEEFKKFIQDSGHSLKMYAVYESMREHFQQSNPESHGWLSWPDCYRNPDSSEVNAYIEKHSDNIQYYFYLQWLAETQLAHAYSVSKEAIEFGIYQDLALGAEPNGSEVWINKELFALQASMGAPPDDLGPQGQNWGLPPPIPDRIQKNGYRLFSELLAYNMKYASILRIDHIMSLMRLFWIPKDAPASEGAYVRYPLHDLLGILKLESVRNECVVVGEDLGTVPDEVRHGMWLADILSYKVLFFMKNDQGYLAPHEYPTNALVVTSTHDLPTLRGYIEGLDIHTRNRLGFVSGDKDISILLAERRDDLCVLLNRLKEYKLLDHDFELDFSNQNQRERFSLAVHQYLSLSPTILQAVQLEDLNDQAEQVNVPGTTNECPNWRRKMQLESDKIFESPFAHSLANTLNILRNGRR